ncbi:uncharacterized protein LOC124543464 [Vanessa cardui]|uniref:uncharacterized protein LOC124543464 n=1 Tax=Vanessa cardui TaxID=171605 RepID=UPI001F12FAEF|nr:uncharacterized protein LOC124543464 [Vanessa cardui]
MFHTPVKGSNMEQSPRMVSTSSKHTETAGTSSTNETSQVRKSIGEWETKGPHTKKRASTEVINISPPAKDREQVKSTDRVTQARIWLRKAKTHLSESRNLKTDLKAGITMALDEMFKLMKEEANDKTKGQPKKDGTFIKEKSDKGTMTEEKDANNDIISMLQWQKQKIEETFVEIGKVATAVTTLQNAASTQTMTYAEVASAPATTNLRNRKPAIHSILIAPKNETDTGDQVLERVRKAVNAKDGWITIEKVRKVKDRKVIVGCKTIEDRSKLKERLRCVEEHIHIEEVKNQDPMVILKDVLAIHSEEDILTALRNQNKTIFKDINKQDDRMVIKYHKKARNPHTRHVVVRVSPVLHHNMIQTGTVHIDIQKIRVADQSPLVQCSMCLGYGHGRRFCKETEPKCCHCGGSHFKEKCSEWIAGASPRCTNCTSAKLEDTEHNAFSDQCPIRRRWEALARAKIAYC